MKVVSYILSALLVLVSCATGEDSATLLRSEEDLAGCKVATVNGSYYARLLSAREDLQTMLFSQEADAVQALLIGKADVLVSDETLLNRDFRSEHGIEIAFKGIAEQR